MKMQSLYERFLLPLALALSALVVCAGGYLAYLSPERRWPYFVTAAVVFAGWIARYAAGTRADAKAASNQVKITQGIVSGGLVLALALGTKLIAHFG